MSRKRLGRLQRAATIVPLALLSAAWTASVAGIGGVPPAVSASQTPEGSLPDGTSVPTDAIEAPASVSDPDALSPTGNTQNIVATASTNQIPSAALAAYQRAEAVINKADNSCHLTWQLVAAIGRVESNHGRFGGNVLDDDGVARPGIYGPALNGRKSTKAISDTDAGQFDRDSQWDRAVGPMQFIPSTWSIVGVDADGDAKRDPQDIDDAALATAVYLCSGKDNLSTVMGQRAAVYRYNHNQKYVDLVLSIMDAYLEGDFTTIPNNTTSAGYIVPEIPAYNPGTHNGTDSPGDAPDYSDRRRHPDHRRRHRPHGSARPDRPAGPDRPRRWQQQRRRALLDPDDNNVPDTGVPPVDDTLSSTLLTACSARSRQAVARIQCPAKALLKFPLPTQVSQRTAWNNSCLSSYGL